MTKRELIKKLDEIQGRIGDIKEDLKNAMEDIELIETTLEELPGDVNEIEDEDE